MYSGDWRTQPQDMIVNQTMGTYADSTARTEQANVDDWQEEVYQKIKAMKEMYLPELNEMYQKIATKLQQQSSLPQQPRSEQLDKLKIFQTMLERIIMFLQVSKSNILPGFKEKLGSYEKQIMNFIRINRPRTPAPIMQQGHLPPPQVELMQQQQQTQRQINQVQSRENQTNLQQQSVNLQGSMPAMQQNIMTNLEHSSMSSLPFASMSQPTMMGSLQPGSNLDSVQGNALSSLQQVTRSLQQIRLSAPQQANMENLQSQASWLQLQHPQFQQQPNSLQRDTKQQMQASAPLDSIAYTEQVNGGDWQEEVFQKIKAMKEMYLPEMNETYQKICAKLQQLDSLPRQPLSAELDNLKIFKSMLEHIISFLQVSKSDIPPGLKEKLGSYEEEIRNFISCNRA